MDVEEEGIVKRNDNCDQVESQDQDTNDVEQPLLSTVSPTKPKVEMKINIPYQKQESCLKVPSFQKQQSVLGSIRIAVYVKRYKQHANDADIGGVDCSHYILELEKGRQTSAGEIKEEMLKILHIPLSSAHLFAMWLISPYLELQLQYQHPPFYMRKQWCDLLVSLSTCPLEELHIDEPVLVFQRNSFISLEDEKKETDENVLKHLFQEAVFNILNARYPVPIPDAEMLGGILLRCYEGHYQENVHKPGFFRKRLNEFLPYYAIGSNKISQAIYSSGVEQRLLQHYSVASVKCGDLVACYTTLLEYCRSLDFYGCAFFKGSCYQESGEFQIWKREHLPVTLGLNRLGITFFKVDMEEVIAHLRYDQFSWDMKDDEEDERGNPMHQLIIEYDYDSDTRQIMIVSKQCSLMDAMVESCQKFFDDVRETLDGVNDLSNLVNISYKLDNVELQKNLGEDETNAITA